MSAPFLNQYENVLQKHLNNGKTTISKMSDQNLRLKILVKNCILKLQKLFSTKSTILPNKIVLNICCNLS